MVNLECWVAWVHIYATVVNAVGIEIDDNERRYIKKRAIEKIANARHIFFGHENGSHVIRVYTDSPTGIQLVCKTTISGTPTAYTGRTEKYD